MSEGGVVTPRGIWSRRIRLFILLGILLALLARIGVDGWANRRLAAESVRLNAKYGDLDGRSIVAPRVPPTDDRARLVKAAAALTLPATEDPDFPKLLEKFKEHEQQPVAAPLSADLGAFVDANGEALRLADEARSRRESSWNVDYSSNNTPPLLEMRTLSDVIYLAAVAEIDAGRPDDAEQRLASGLAVAASIRQEPSLITQLIRVALVLRQCEGAIRLIVRAEPSKAALEDLARWLADNDNPDPMRVGLLGELRHEHRAFLDLEEGRRQGAPWAFVAPLAWLGRPLVEMAHLHYLQDMERLLDNEAGARPRPPFVASSSGPLNLAARVAEVSLAGLERSIETGDLFTSTLGATELGVALRRFRVDHGAYPVELAALVPAYVSRLPIDPFTGNPPVYTRADQGFTLHAEGGAHATPRDSALDWSVAR